MLSGLMWLKKKRQGEGLPPAIWSRFGNNEGEETPTVKSRARTVAQPARGASPDNVMNIRAACTKRDSLRAADRPLKSSRRRLQDKDEKLSPSPRQSPCGEPSSQRESTSPPNTAPTCTVCDTGDTVSAVGVTSETSRRRCKIKTGFTKREPIDGVHCTVFLPAHVSPRGTLLFLHGRGQSGTDNVGNLQAGLPQWLQNEPERWPVAVVIPQKPEKDQPWGAYEGQVLRHLDSFIDDARLDRRRVAVTGLSQGGHGTVHIAANHPKRFRAVAAICYFPTYTEGQLKHVGKREAAPETARLAACLSRLPVRLYHGGSDGIVPTARSRELHDALKEHNANVTLRIYPRTGHQAWTKAYHESDLAEWLVSQLGKKMSSV